MKKYVELTSNQKMMRGYHHQVDSDKIVVMFHGFTGHKTESGYLFRKLSDRLELEQIDSIRFDYFGSGESDGYFSDMTLDVLIEQAKIIIEYVNRLKYKKIYILGFSMGGALALNLLDYADKAVLLSPAIEFHLLNLNNMPSMVELENGHYDLNGFELNKNLFSSFKKDYNQIAKNYTKPVLIIQGTKDAAVNYKSVQQFSKHFNDCDLELIEDGGHVFNQRDHYIKLENKIVEFLK